MHNLARFYTTSDLHREYLSNETRYPKSERHVIENDSSCVQRKKSDELWSSIQKVEHEFGPTQIDFFRETTFWTLKFLQALEFDQGLLAPTTNRVGGPQKHS